MKSVSKFRKIISQYRYIFLISVPVLLLLVWFFVVSNIRQAVVNDDGSDSESNFNQSSSNTLETIDCTGTWANSPLCRERAEALSQIKRYSELKEKLISLNVQVWADEKFTAFVDIASKGDQLFNQEYFGKSAAIYTEANNGLIDLVNASSKILEQYIRSGFKHLEKEKSSEAIEEFNKALAIEADNVQAKEGINRATVLDNLLLILEEIRILIEVNDLDTAQIKMVEALELDKKNNEAIELNKELEALLDQKDFDMAITKGYIYIEKNDFTKALDSFQRAFALGPSSQAAISGIFEAEQGIKTNKITELEKKANRMEKQEQWQSVLNTYNEILSMDNNIQVAKNGILKAKKVILLESELDRLLSQPKRVASLDVTAEARKIISDSEELKLGPRLQSKINSLISTLDQYSIRVKLQLISDGKTTITIQRAGNLGKFKNKELRLPPGKYTFIGKRSGYKTVRKTIEINNNTTLELVCFQRI